MAEERLLAGAPVADIGAYRAAGGGQGLAAVERLGAAGVVAELRRAGLRGRGGAGFPTGIKWQGLLDDPSSTRFCVANAAEGEPGTFKDRWLLRQNPYLVLEGLAAAAATLETDRAFLGIKSDYRTEIERLEQAATELNDEGLLGDIAMEIVEGPDDYLLGEEKALLETIEGHDPLPRLNPPYIHGLFANGGPGNPAVVNNVETLANVPLILSRGADWFRSAGTEDSPGTMIFTLTGDVRRESVAELPLGTPLSYLIYGVGEGLAEGRRVKAVWAGASNGPVTTRDLDVPMDFQSMNRVGSGLGSAGFFVIDDTRCALQTASVFSEFLWEASCGQCPPCKLGTEAITQRLNRLEAGLGDQQTLEEVVAWMSRVTDANRCGLGAGEQNMILGLVRNFIDELADHVRDGCPFSGSARLPMLVEYWAEDGRFSYADGSSRSQS